MDFGIVEKSGLRKAFVPMHRFDWYLVEEMLSVVDLGLSLQNSDPSGYLKLNADHILVFPRLSPTMVVVR